MVEPENGVVLAGVVMALMLLTVVFGILVFHKTPWPFKVLKPSGRHEAEPLTIDSDVLEERKRDFARTVSHGQKSGLLVLTQEMGSPQPWSCSRKPDGDLTKEATAAIFEEFQSYVVKEVRGFPEGGWPELAERIISMLSVSVTFSFAIHHKIPALFPQSKYILLFGGLGEVRVLWVAFITPEVKADLQSTPYILNLLSSNLNIKAAQEADGKIPLQFQYSVVETKAKTLEDYMPTKVAALNRGVVEGTWTQLIEV